ncbi:MAG: type II toxin-antitoxin system YoeB family toxin [Ruminococcus sp.]|nr:type II toxin-antitoxin system YoeB family toxin [Ruminococcus sp.]
MSNYSFSENAWEEYLFWQAQDKKTLKRIKGTSKNSLPRISAKSSRHNFAKTP